MKNIFHKSLLKSKLLLIISVIVFCSEPVFALETKDYSADFETIENQNRFVEDFLSIGAGAQNPQNLPIGIKKIVGNIPITIAVSNIKFGNQYGELTLFVKMEIPQKSKTLIFGANDIKISSDGDLIGDVKLSLLSDVPISLGNMGTLVLKGSMNDSTGVANSSTFISLDCNGNFKEMSVDANIILNENTFKSITSGKDKQVKASFRTVINDWNDLIIQTTFPAFEIKGMEGFQFELQNAILDLSDMQNAPSFNPPAEYFDKYFTLPDKNLWRGLYVDKFSLTFPEQFNNKQTKQRLKIETTQLLIDENGITGNITGYNILPLEGGDANGWAFSVIDFRLGLMANNITGFGFGGQINVAISEKSQLFTYEAYISNEKYLFKVGLGDTLTIDLFTAAKFNLDPTSYLQIEVIDKKFYPQLVLNGSMQLSAEILKMEQITFKKLALSTETLSVESVGYGGEIKLSNFPITISDINFSAIDGLATLGFDLKVNLMEGKISAASSLEIASEYHHGHWTFKGVTVKALKLDKIELSGFSLKGEVRMEKNNPVYGNYFGGSIEAKFDALSDGLSVKVTALFGTKGFRYWYVEGQVEFAPGIQVSFLTINGFIGGAYYHMLPTGLSGLDAYVPDDKISLGVKAGICYAIGGKSAVNGQAVFEMNFLSTGGIKSIRFYGTAEFMANLPGGDKMAKLGELRSQAQSKAKTSGGGSLADGLDKNMNSSEVAQKVLPEDVEMTAAINALLTMEFDFPTKTFDANFKVRINVAGGILQGSGPGGEAGWARLYFSPETWYVHVGTPSNPCGIKVGLGSMSLNTESYFMLGKKLEKAPPPPKQVLDILKITPEETDYMKYPEKMELGAGVGFGARMNFDTGDLNFLIIYARFAMGVGFDLMLSDMSNYACEGSNTPIGLNGWYANGQCYSYMQGELGVRVKLLFINKQISIIKGAAATLLQAKLPNPTWVGGQMALQLNILGGLVKADMKMKFSFGDDCKLVSIDGNQSPLDLPMISDLTPLEKDKNVDVFISPQVTLNMKERESFTMEDENGNTKSYRIKLEDFYILDNNNNKIEGTVKWNNKRDAATFESKEVLPPNSQMKVYVSVNFEEYNNGSWNAVIYNGQPAREVKSANFETGGAPNYIPLTNIAYCYPVVGQKNFFLQEASSGYIQLKKGQNYLFPENFAYNANFTAKTGQVSKVTFKYNSANSSI
ncbi:MAG: hypothetical protein LBN27_04490, partial [Prevotellaceae bacterium]|nr:hypothetical protein [Prevotellaceae bacterium]